MTLRRILMDGQNLTRCGWCLKDDLYRNYHDQEWAVPVTDDRKLFEFVVLESAQAGLSWHTILKKRDGYRRIFKDFDVDKVAKMTSQEIEKALLDPAIIRNRAKVLATISNAQAFIKIQDEFGSFSDYMWRLVDGKPKVNRWKELKQIPATTKESDIFAKDLKQRGFKFMGSTVVYAHMQAVGMVNDHLISCYRHGEV